MGKLRDRLEKLLCEGNELAGISMGAYEHIEEAIYKISERV